MKKWNPSTQYAKIAEANRQYYAKTSELYDRTEVCVTNQHSQQALEADLNHVVELCSRPPEALHALDACGGSGNISLKLLRLGLNVTICDISPDLLGIFQQKAAARGFSADVVCGEIGEFFARQEQAFDLITFSSALHHLENIDDVLAGAYANLKPEGMVYTIFDPVSRRDLSWWTRTLIQLDYYVFKIIGQTEDLLPAIMRRWRRTRRKVHDAQTVDKDVLEIDANNLGVLAEYHVETGIDDHALVERLKQLGFEIIWHQRYPSARYALTRSLLREPTSFKLLLKKPHSD